MEFYIAMRMNQLQLHATLWKDLAMMLNEKSQTQKSTYGASLVAQWLRICLPMQGTRVRALVWEGPTCHGATKPVRHNY